MQTRRHYVGALASAALAGCGFTVESSTETAGSGTPLVFSTPAFEDGGTIPAEYTGVGADRSPPLSVESVPETAETLALVVDDPDADGFVHWLLWNVPASVPEVPADQPQTETLPDLGGARQGTNDFGELGYRGPLPPEGDGPHTYRFTMSAVPTTLDVEAGASRSELESALEAETVATHRVTGDFER